jgi:hypothetical protein
MLVVSRSSRVPLMRNCVEGPTKSFLKELKMAAMLIELSRK